MKAFSKITLLAAAAAFLASCEMEYYKEELYRKEIFIVSGENNILGQEFEYGEEGCEGKLAIYSSGTTRRCAGTGQSGAAFHQQRAGTFRPV